jgi:hypothetical protein
MLKAPRQGVDSDPIMGREMGHEPPLASGKRALSLTGSLSSRPNKGSSTQRVLPSGDNITVFIGRIKARPAMLTASTAAM